VNTRMHFSDVFPETERDTDMTIKTQAYLQGYLHEKTAGLPALNTQTGYEAPEVPGAKIKTWGLGELQLPGEQATAVEIPPAPAAPAAPVAPVAPPSKFDFGQVGEMSGALGDGGGFDFDARAQERKREREGIRRPLAQTSDAPPPALSDKEYEERMAKRYPQVDFEDVQSPARDPERGNAFYEWQKAIEEQQAQRAEEADAPEHEHDFEDAANIADTAGDSDNYWRRSFSDVPLDEWDEEEWDSYMQSPEAGLAAEAAEEERRRYAFSKIPLDEWTTEEWQRYNRAYPRRLQQPRPEEWHRQLFSKIPLDEWTEEEWDRYRHSNPFQIADIDQSRIFSRDVLGHDPERHQDDWTMEEYERYLTFLMEKETEEGPMTQEQAEEAGWERYSNRNDREKEIGADALKRERKKAKDLLDLIFHVDRGGLGSFSEEEREQAEEYLEMFIPGGVFDNDDGWYDGPPDIYDENPQLQRPVPGDRDWQPPREA
jgi:hypothetical protein